MDNNAVKIDEKDNVVVAIRNIDRGDAVMAKGETVVSATEDVRLGHKIAITPIKSGEKVYRYGEPIVEATKDINTGEWVHVHNTRPIAREI